jgi:hypothetical protein
VTQLGFPGRRGAPMRGLAIGLAMTIALGVLAGCGKEHASPTPTATASVSAGGTPQGGTTLTVGTLADRIGAAWPGVSTYRRVTTTRAEGVPARPGTAAAGASPGASGADIVETIDEVILPDRRRYLGLGADGAVRYELIAVAGSVYARGTLVPGLSPTRPDADAWVEVDPAAFADSPYAGFYAELVGPVPVPYSALSPARRSRDAVALGQTSVNGRECTAYRFAETTETGERLEIVLTLGADDLPCSIETRGGGQTTTTVVTYNLPLTIEPPRGATPIADET